MSDGGGWWIQGIAEAGAGALNVSEGIYAQVGKVAGMLSGVPAFLVLLPRIGMPDRQLTSDITFRIFCAV